MSENHDAAARGHEAPEYLAKWVSRQRWYASTEQHPQLRSIGSWSMESGEPGVSIRTHLILDAGSERAELYQVPVTERRQPLPNAQALIAETDVSGDIRYYYDAPHDQAYVRALLSLISADSGVEGSGAAERGAADTDAAGSRAARTNATESAAAHMDADESAAAHTDPGQGRTADKITDGVATAHGQAFGSGDHASAAGRPTAVGMKMTSSRVLGGEQSNTSIIIDVVDQNLVPGRSIICKVFRMLHNGQNPDVAVQLALAGAGSPYIPWPIGQVVGEWADPVLPDGRATGHLAFAQEFLPGVEDAWRVALRAAEAGDDLSERARALGRATAEVHMTLAAVMPTHPATRHVIATILEGMHERHRTAEREVPSLAQHRDAIDSVFSAAESADWPMLQRIHGDYHLGQVLNVPGRGWVLIDFEGEPLRPMSERNQPDVPLRDVAGMLRSFSYAAGAVSMQRSAAGRVGETSPDRPGYDMASAHPDRKNTDRNNADRNNADRNNPDRKNPLTWAFACRAAFLDGYAESVGKDPRDNRSLLDAFELDKALYEAVYETRNRPGWVSIPLTAIRHLIADGDDGTPDELQAYA